MEDLILVSNWEQVEEDNFYLSNEWSEEEDIENIENARKLQKEGKLYYAYIVRAKDYALYRQMDADECFIDEEGDYVLRCESQIINTGHSYIVEYE